MASRSNSAHVERSPSPISNSHHAVVVEEPADGDAEQLGFETSRFANEHLKSSSLRRPGPGNETQRYNIGTLPGADSGIDENNLENCMTTNVMNTMISDQRLKDYENVLQKQKTVDQIVERMDQSLMTDAANAAASVKVNLQYRRQDAEIEKKQLRESHIHSTSSIPLKSSILLGPFTKYRYYSQFPFKVVVHLIVCALAILLAFEQNRMDKQQFLPQVKAFYYKFMLRDDASSLNDLHGQETQKVFYQVPAMRTFIVESTALYFDWDNDPICPKDKPDCDRHILLNQIYTHKDKFAFQKPQAHFKYDEKYVQAYMQNPANKGKRLEYSHVFNDASDFGPFEDAASTKQKFGEVAEISINFTFYSYLKTYDPYDKEKMSKWIVNQNYAFNDGGLATLTLKIHQFGFVSSLFGNTVDGGSFAIQAYDNYLIVCVLSLFTFSIISIILHIRHIFKMSNIFQSFLYKYDHKAADDEDGETIEGPIDTHYYPDGKTPTTPSKRDIRILQHASSEIQNKRLSRISVQNTAYRNSLLGVTKKTKIFQNNSDLQQSIKNKSNEYKLGHSDMNQQQLMAYAQAFDSKLSEIHQQFDEDEIQEENSSDEDSQDYRYAPLATRQASRQPTMNRQSPMQTMAKDQSPNRQKSGLIENQTASQMFPGQRESSIMRELFFEKIKQKVLLNLNDKQEELRNSATSKYSEEVAGNAKGNEFTTVQGLNTWNQLPYANRLELYDAWNLVIAAGNFMHIISCFFYIFPRWLIYLGTLKVLLGFGTFLVLLAITKYSQYNQRNNVLPATVANTSGPMLRQLASTLPLMIGIAYYGMGAFGNSWRFNALDKSMVMLWATWNGDELQNLYHNLTPINFLGAFVFCWSWIWFSNNMIHNAFLAMVEDGYVKQEKVQKFSWLKNELHEDPIDRGVIDEHLEEDGPQMTCEDFIERLKKTQLIQHELMYSNSKYKMNRFHIREMIEMDSQKELQAKIKSKRTLRIMLRVDELEWDHKLLAQQQHMKLSQLADGLIVCKLQFHEMHIQEILKNIQKILDTGKVQMNALKDLQKTLTEESSRAQSFTAHLQFMNEMGPTNHARSIKAAFSHASEVCGDSTAMLEEMIGRLEDFEDELEGDMREDERQQESQIEMNEYEEEDKKEK